MLLIRFIIITGFLLAEMPAYAGIDAMEVQGCELTEPQEHYSLATDQLRGIISTLHDKWKESPELVRNLDESQIIWQKSLESTCDKLVERVYTTGSLSGAISDRCRAKAILRRVELLRDTFRSSLEN
jgi:hypothetical protein